MTLWTRYNVYTDGRIQRTRVDRRSDSDGRPAQSSAHDEIGFIFLRVLPSAARWAGPLRITRERQQLEPAPTALSRRSQVFLGAPIYRALCLIGKEPHRDNLRLGRPIIARKQ